MMPRIFSVSQDNIEVKFSFQSIENELKISYRLRRRILDSVFEFDVLDGGFLSIKNRQIVWEDLDYLSMYFLPEIKNYMNKITKLLAFT